MGAIRFFSDAEINSPDDLNNLNQTNRIEGLTGKTVVDEAYYDLQGNKVSISKESLKPGLYIHKGKKIIVR